MKKPNWSRIFIMLLLLASVAANYVLWASASHDDMEVRMLRANMIPVCVE